MIIRNTVFKMNRAVLLLVALARFALTGQNAHAQEAIARTADPNMSSSANAPQHFTRKQLKKLIATAKSPEDYRKLSRYYTAQANKLDAEAAEYEKTAAAYRNGPYIKNLMAPNTAARYDSFAKSRSEEAKSDRALAALVSNGKPI
jgi:hypothetical protein